MSTKRRNLSLAIAVGLGTAAAAGKPAHASTTPVEFDLSQLQQNGFGAEMAAFFAREPRFLPGVHPVGVSVNAGRRQELQVRFNGEGEACIDSALLFQLAMRVPHGQEQVDCIDLAQSIPGARMVTRPGTSQIDLTVPQDAFVKGFGDDLQRGGKALVVNYDLFTQTYQSRNTRRNHVSARLEAGVNIANWALRSRGDYSRSADVTRFTRHETFAQRPVEALDALLQVGELHTLADGFGGLPITGVQLHSDTAQQQGQTLAVPITGVAGSNAVVEVRQRNRVVYRTVVAPGAFSISEVGAVSRGADIDVVVTEEDGREHRFTVPAPMAGSDVPERPTFHVGAGRYRASSARQERARPRPWVVYGDYAFEPIKRVRLTASGLFSAGYLGAAVQGTWSPRGRMWVGGGLRVSNSRTLGAGVEWQLQGNAQLPGGISAGLSWQTRTRGFSLLEDTLHYRREADRAGVFQQSASASLGWSHARWGSLSYGIAQSRMGNDTRLSHGLSAARRIGRINVGLSLQHSQQRGRSVFLNVQVPLGHSSVNLRAYQSGNRSQFVGASYSDRIGTGTSYQFDASRSGDSQRLGGALHAQMAYGSLAAGMSQINGDTRAYYGSARGGIALTGGGVALSASRIGDTFAIVKVPDVSGIRMSGAGSARTSRSGTALLPTVTPYRRNRVQLDGSTLPLNYRFDTTAVDLMLARGTVATHTIKAKQFRQLMLSVTTSEGPARVGAPVYDGDGEFIGTVVGDGNVVLVNEQIGQPVYIEQGGRRCQADYQAPKQFDPQLPYEQAPASCR